jgi:hypothetical protein
MQLEQFGAGTGDLGIKNRSAFGAEFHPHKAALFADARHCARELVAHGGAQTQHAAA